MDCTNEKLEWKNLYHICRDKEIVETVHHQLLGNWNGRNMTVVSIVTMEAHVLNDDRLQTMPVSPNRH